MPSFLKRFNRSLYNGARVDLPLAITAGSMAWSLAGRGSLLHAQDRASRLRIEPGDRALPIVNRN